MIHRILGYLWCKTEYLTRHSDTSMYSWHVPSVLSAVIIFYGVDIALIYWAATSVNPGHFSACLSPYMDYFVCLLSL